MSKVSFRERNNPSTPSAGIVNVFIDTSGNLCWQDDTGKIGKLATAGSFTLTIPATGTAALLGTAQTFSAAQTFSNVLTAPGMKPASDSTTAWQIQDTGGTAVLTVDTTNRQLTVLKTVSGGDGGAIFIRNDGTNNNSSATLIMGHETGNFRLKTYSYPAAMFGADLSFDQRASIDSWVTAVFIQRSSNNVGIGTTSPDTRLDIDAGAIEFAEMTAPSGGAANTARLFAQDNGSGKTQLCVIFNSGAIQVLATEP